MQVYGNAFTHVCVCTSSRLRELVGGPASDVDLPGVEYAIFELCRLNSLHMRIFQEYESPLEHTSQPYTSDFYRASMMLSETTCLCTDRLVAHR